MDRQQVGGVGHPIECEIRRSTRQRPRGAEGHPELRLPIRVCRLKLYLEIG